jgi:hypothetical protein
MALEGLTYGSRLVQNKDIAIERIRHRLQDLEIQIDQRTQETTEAMKLLNALERPKALIAGQLTAKDELPIIDTNALEHLLKSDYVGPVVHRISRLQEEAKSMEADKARLQRQLALLPSATNLDSASIPAYYRTLFGKLASELENLVQGYNALVEEYLTAAVTSLVSVKRSPIVTRTGYSPALLLFVIIFLSTFISFLWVIIEHLMEKARLEPQ